MDDSLFRVCFRWTFLIKKNSFVYRHYYSNLSYYDFFLIRVIIIMAKYIQMHSKGFVSSNKGSHPSLRECISKNLSTTLIELFSLS